MSRQASPALIGGFTLGAAVLVVAGILIFGSGKFFTTSHDYVLYFDGAVNGLQVGAPVRFQGVQVGSVTDIKATIQEENLEIRIPVFIEIEEGSIEQVGNPRRREIDQEFGVRVLVRRGMRAQLQMQSFVTGILSVQFDIHPKAEPAEVTYDPDTGLLELPTVPTTFQKAEQTIRHALETLGGLPLEEMFTDLLKTINGIEQLVNSPAVTGAFVKLDETLGDMQQLLRRLEEEVSPTASTFNTTMKDFRQLVRDLDEQIQPLVASVTKTVEAAQVTITQAGETFSGLGPASPLRHEISQTLEDLREAARAIRILAHELQRQPDALLRGKGTPKK